MNKKIKRIVAMALVLGAFSSISPTGKYFDLLITKASAASDSDYGIDNLEVRKGNLSKDDEEDTFTLYTSGDYNNSISFEQSEYDYYVKTSANSINIKISKISGYTYKIFKSGSSKAYSSSDDLDLKSGNNVFIVKTYRSGDFNEKNIEENQLKSYEVHVERKTSASIYLKDIYLTEGKISFSKNTLSYNIEVDSDVDEINITGTPEDTDNTLYIDGTKLTDNENFKKKISLNKGKNTIKMEIQDAANNSKTYTLNIYRGTKATASTSTVQYGAVDYSQPSVYLENLQLNSGDISLDFKKNVSIYNVKVDSTVDEIKVMATPDNSDYKVEINNKKLTSDKDYEASLQNLKTGENAFTIKVTNSDGKSRNYTLNVYRGVSVPSTTITTVEVKANKWVQVSGRWQYNDKDGKPVKSQLFYDDNYKKTYYLNAEGYLEAGWISYGGKYYYTDNSGAVQKGWLNLGPTWYHLDANTGAMDIGWYKDGEKWYYLESTGAMAHDKYIDKYKLGSDGAML
jgi:glucan-binding YG repeat protein